MNGILGYKMYDRGELSLEARYQRRCLIPEHTLGVFVDDVSYVEKLIYLRE